MYGHKSFSFFTVKVWDMRQNKAVMDVKEHEEFISDMDVEKNKRYLVATSGDGTLSAFDIRKHKLKLQSELFDSELLSVAIIKACYHFFKFALTSIFISCCPNSC